MFGRTKWLVGTESEVVGWLEPEVKWLVGWNRSEPVLGPEYS